jgi:gluconate 2-dehydrogenase gamma chain
MERREFMRRLGLCAAVLPLRTLPAFAAEPGVAPAAVAALNADELRLLAAVAEGIIPTTDTPGAVAAQVPEFLALLYSEWMLEDERAQFRQQLQFIDDSAQKRYHAVFAACNVEQQSTLLEHWDADRMGAQPLGQARYFTRLRSLVLVGYYTSEIGQSTELKVQYGGGANHPGGPIFGAVPVHI